MPNTRRRQYDVPETRGSKRKAAEATDAQGSPEPKTLKKTDIKDLYERLDRERNSRIEEEAKRDLGYAEESLARRPNPEDWRDVIFSTHFDLYYKTEGADWIYTSATGPPHPEKMDRKRLRCWSAFGYNLKCPLVWREMPEKCSTKQVQQLYIDKVLEPHVKKLLDKDYTLALEEVDGKDGPLKSWIEQFDAGKFIACPEVPGESPLEKTWRVPERYLENYQFWDVETLQGVTAETWKEVSQDEANDWVESMPKRLQHVKKQKGKKPARQYL